MKKGGWKRRKEQEREGAGGQKCIHWYIHYFFSVVDGHAFNFVVLGCFHFFSSASCLFVISQYVTHAHTHTHTHTVNYEALQ